MPDIQDDPKNEKNVYFPELTGEKSLQGMLFQTDTFIPMQQTKKEASFESKEGLSFAEKEALRILYVYTLEEYFDTAHHIQTLRMEPYDFYLALPAYRKEFFDKKAQEDKYGAFQDIPREKQIEYLKIYGSCEDALFLLDETHIKIAVIAGKAAEKNILKKQEDADMPPPAPNEQEKIESMLREEIHRAINGIFLKMDMVLLEKEKMQFVPYASHTYLLEKEHDETFSLITEITKPEWRDSKMLEKKIKSSIPPQFIPDFLEKIADINVSSKEADDAFSQAFLVRAQGISDSDATHRIRAAGFGFLAGMDLMQKMNDLPHAYKLSRGVLLGRAGISRLAPRKEVVYEQQEKPRVSEPLPHFQPAKKEPASTKVEFTVPEDEQKRMRKEQEMLQRKKEEAEKQSLLAKKVQKKAMSNIKKAILYMGASAGASGGLASALALWDVTM